MGKTSENELEKHLISVLKEDLKYTYREDITNRSDLEKNFKKHFEALNRVNLTDDEFKRLLSANLISGDIFKVAKMLRTRESIERDDGTSLYYDLVNLQDWCKNEFEVIHQLRINTENSYHRYDVILLMNGLPVAQIELKRGDINPKNALKQIVNYKNDPGNGYTNTLLCFIQIFIVSNGNSTYYFSNNKKEHFNFDVEEKFLPIYSWADQKNNKIHHLTRDFSQAFLDKCALAEMIVRYMVLIETEKKILMMRPYQIYAVKNIITSIKDHAGNGYIWHTTGSGKTLTSFKASIVLKDDPHVDKCLFVVDRKDLDKQTRDEFNKFQKGCVEENTNTQSLINKLLSDDIKDKVVVTTIQKLGLALNTNKDYKDQLSKLKDKRFVFIFDECHRSQFGANHKAIKEFFPRSQMFGFTGTPIFEENATQDIIEDGQASKYTTKDLFEHELHSYTITHAIHDENVLKFRIDHYTPEETDNKNKKAIVKAILNIHQQQTLDTRFNALFATNSIRDAIEYYHLFKQVQEEREKEDPEYKKLQIACVFSPPSQGNLEVKQIQEDLPQEKEDYKADPEGKKKALEEIIQDYNQQFGTNHKIEDFDKYYQDIQKRIKDQQYLGQELTQKKKIDITIVVDMLLTGFDSKYLNTLYIDKNLKYHGLIQAFSRTNRTLNSSKPYGNVVDFYGLKDPVDQAIKLFSGISPDNVKEVWTVQDYSTIKAKLSDQVQNLKEVFTSKGLEPTPDQVHNLGGLLAQQEFLTQFKELRKLMLAIQQYKEMDKQEIDGIFSPKELQEFSGVYIEFVEKLKDPKTPSPEDPKPEEFDGEYVLFHSVTIDYDYIMKLVSDLTYTKTQIDKAQILQILLADAKFIQEREYIEKFMDTLHSGDEKTPEQIEQEYRNFKENLILEQFREVAKKQGIEWEELDTILQKVKQLGRLDPAEDFAPITDKLYWKEMMTESGDQLVLAVEEDNFNAFNLLSKNLAAGIQSQFIEEKIVAATLVDDEGNELIDDLVNNFVVNLDSSTALKFKIKNLMSMDF